MGKVGLLGVQELNFSNQEFRTRSMKLEAFWQNDMSKYVTQVSSNVILLQKMLITVQRVKVIWKFPSQHNLNFCAVHSVDESRISADSNVVGIVKYLFTNFCETMCCCVRFNC